MTIKEIDSAIEEGQSLKQIAQAYSEIANLKIKKIRAEVERNRVFFREISKVYSLIKKLAAKRKIIITKPKKTASIALTSNHRFYGQINSDLLEFFAALTAKLDTDRIILGKMGIDALKAQSAGKNFREVILKEDQPSADELKMLVNNLKDYNQVLVFYSSMKSLLVQQPIVTDITASSGTDLRNNPTLKPGLDNSEDLKFIFEPDLPKILEFFDNQIITLLLEATFLESELSRTASRFISMDSAESAANKFIDEHRVLKVYAKRNMDNNTILENFASMMALRKETLDVRR